MLDMVLFAKCGLGLVCLAGYLIFVSSQQIAALSGRRFHMLIAFLWLFTRVGLYCTIFLLLKMDVTSDVSGFYYPEGQRARIGLIIYRDFTSNYSPAFPYIVAVILNVWNSAKAIVLASILIEGISLVIWLKVIRGMFPTPTYRAIAGFYVLSALAILDVAIAGQNQVWIALLLGAAVLLYQQKRPVLSAVVAGLPILLVKFLPLLYIPAFLCWRSKPFRIATAATALPCVFFCVLLMNGIDVVQPARLQGSLITAGNLPYLFSLVFSLRSRFAAFALPIIAIFLIGSISLYLIAAHRNLCGRQVVFSMVILTLMCALINKKFFPSYLMMAFVPICAVGATDPSPLRAAIRFGIFNLAACMEPALWFRFLKAEEQNSQLWQVLLRLQQVGQQWKLWVFLGIELLLLSCYAYYLMQAYRLFHHSVQQGGEKDTEVYCNRA